MQSKDPDIKIIYSTYKLVKKIDEGAFGKIYQAIDLKRKKNNGTPTVAVKMQSLRARNVQLLYQCKIYSTFLADPNYNDKGIPSVYYCGVEGQYNTLVMDLMGPSLQSLFQKSPHRKMSMKTVLMLLDQMLTRIEYVHSKCIIHRDIKPDNFCMGIQEKANKLFIIDFGLAKRYSRDGKHIPYRQGKALTGTARYASVNTHLGAEQSRRDDLESIAYVCIYLNRGKLPWQGLQGKDKDEKYRRIKDKKVKITIEELCKGLPVEFSNFVTLAKNLRFDQKPDYQAIRDMFGQLFQKQNYRYDFIYDWTAKDGEKKTEA